MRALALSLGTLACSSVLVLAVPSAVAPLLSATHTTSPAPPQLHATVRTAARAIRLEADSVRVCVVEAARGLGFHGLGSVWLPGGALVTVPARFELLHELETRFAACHELAHLQHHDAELRLGVLGALALASWRAAPAQTTPRRLGVSLLAAAGVCGVLQWQEMRADRVAAKSSADTAVGGAILLQRLRQVNLRNRQQQLARFGVSVFSPDGNDRRPWVALLHPPITWRIRQVNEVLRGGDGGGGGGGGVRSG